MAALRAEATSAAKAVTGMQVVVMREPRERVKLPSPKAPLTLDRVRVWISAPK